MSWEGGVLTTEGGMQARSQDFAQGGGGGASKGPLPERSKGPFSSVERVPFPSADLHRGPLNVHGALWSFREGPGGPKDL